LIRMTVPQAKIFSIDPCLKINDSVTEGPEFCRVGFTGAYLTVLDYKDKDTTYFMGNNFIDFSKIDWDKYIPRSERHRALFFLDDHIGFERYFQAAKLGFKYIFIDDNYPDGKEVAPRYVINLEEGNKERERLLKIVHSYYEFPPVTFKSEYQFGNLAQFSDMKTPLLTTENELKLAGLDKYENKHFEYNFPCLLILKDEALYKDY